MGSMETAVATHKRDCTDWPKNIGGVPCKSCEHLPALGLRLPYEMVRHVRR